MAEDWRLLEAGPHKRIYVRYEPEFHAVKGWTVKRIVREVFDEQPALDLAQAQRDMDAHGKDIRHAATVPQSVLTRAIREGWDDAAWKRWANDSDNSRLRTWNGHL